MIGSLLREAGPLPAVRAPSDGVTGEGRVALCLFAEVCGGFGYARSQMSAGARAASVTPVPNSLLFEFSPLPPVRFSARQNQRGKDRLFFKEWDFGLPCQNHYPVVIVAIGVVGLVVPGDSDSGEFGFQHIAAVALSGVRLVVFLPLEKSSLCGFIPCGYVFTYV